jgi:hypothetical protein
VRSQCNTVRIFHRSDACNSVYHGATGLNVQFHAIKSYLMNVYKKNGGLVKFQALFSTEILAANTQAQVAYLNEGRMIDSYSSLVQSCMRDRTGSSTAARTSCVFTSCCRHGQTC